MMTCLLTLNGLKMMLVLQLFSVSVPVFYLNLPLEFMGLTLVFEIRTHHRQRY